MIKLKKVLRFLFSALSVRHCSFFFKVKDCLTWPQSPGTRQVSRDYHVETLQKRHVLSVIIFIKDVAPFHVKWRWNCWAFLLYSEWKDGIVSFTDPHDLHTWPGIVSVAWIPKISFVRDTSAELVELKYAVL